MRRVLVTGAAGGIGRVVVADLVEHGYAVRAADRVAGDANVEWLVGDLTERELAREAVDGVDYVVHLAGIPAPGIVGDAELLANNTGGTFAVLDAAGRAGVGRAIIASSVSVYGLVWSEVEQAPPEVPLSEASPLQVADAYAFAKEVDEACARLVHRRYGIDVLAFRLPYTASAGDVASRGETVRQDPASVRRELWGYLVVDDAAVAVRRGIEADVAGAQVLNVVAPDPLGGVDVGALCAQLFPGVPCAVAPGATGYTSELAERLLGFRATRRWDAVS
jgi:nucleoside-diphosphate-sugar epimerase